MKKGKRKYLIAIIIGVLLTPMAVSEVLAQRGYFAVGGEWLLIPFGLVIVLLVQSIKDFIVATCKSLAEEDEEL